MSSAVATNPTTTTTTTKKPHPMSDVTAKDSQERNLAAGQEQLSSSNIQKRGGSNGQTPKLSEEVLKSNNNNRTTSPDVNRASNVSPLSQASSRMSHNPYAAPRSPLAGSPSMENPPGSFEAYYSGTTSPLLGAAATNNNAYTNNNNNAAAQQQQQGGGSNATNTRGGGTFFSNPPPLPPMQHSNNNGGGGAYPSATNSFGPGSDATYDGTGAYSSSPVGGATSGSGQHHPSAFTGYIDNINNNTMHSSNSFRRNNNEQQYGRGGGGVPRIPQPRGGRGTGSIGGGSTVGRGGGGSRTVSPNNSISGYDRELTDLVSGNSSSSYAAAAAAGEAMKTGATAAAAPPRPTPHLLSTPTKESLLPPPTASTESTPSGVQSITREYRNGRPIPSLRGSNPPSQNTSLLAPSTTSASDMHPPPTSATTADYHHHHDDIRPAPRRTSTAQSRSLSPTELAMMHIASEITAEDEPSGLIPQPRSLRGHQQPSSAATAVSASVAAAVADEALPDFVVVEVQFRNDRRRERHVMRYPSECLGITSSAMLQNAFVVVEGDRGVDLGRIVRMDETATNTFLDSLLHVQKRRFAREDNLSPLDDAPPTTTTTEEEEEEEVALYLTDEEESILMTAASSTELKVMSGILPSDKLTTHCGPMTFLTEEEINLVHDSQTTDKHRRAVTQPGRSSAFYPLHTYDEGQLDDSTTSTFIKSVLTSDHSTRSSSPPTNVSAVFPHHRNILVRATGYMQQLQRESKGHAPTADYFVRRVPANSIVSRFCKFPLVLRNATQEEVDEYHTGLVVEEQRALQSAQELAHQHLPLCNPGLTVLNGGSLNPDGSVTRPPRGQSPHQQFYVDIVDATFQFDKNKLTLWYISSERVYFVPLLKALNQRYRCRIWMERLPSSSGNGSGGGSPPSSDATPFGNSQQQQQRQQSYSQMREHGFHSSSRGNNNNNFAAAGSSNSNTNPRSSARRGAPQQQQQHSNNVSSSSGFAQQQHRDPTAASTTQQQHRSNNHISGQQQHQQPPVLAGGSGRRAVPPPKSQQNANPVKRLSFDEES